MVSSYDGRALLLGALLLGNPAGSIYLPKQCEHAVELRNLTTYATLTNGIAALLNASLDELRTPGFTVNATRAIGLTPTPRLVRVYLVSYEQASMFAAAISERPIRLCSGPYYAAVDKCVDKSGEVYLWRRGCTQAPAPFQHLQRHVVSSSLPK